MRNMRNHFCYSSRNEEYEESNNSFPGNEEAELAKIPGDGDPPPPHWDLYPIPLQFDEFLENS